MQFQTLLLALAATIVAAAPSGGPGGGSGGGNNCGLIISNPGPFPGVSPSALYHSINHKLTTQQTCSVATQSCTQKNGVTGSCIDSVGVPDPAIASEPANIKLSACVMASAALLMRALLGIPLFALEASTRLS